MKLTTMAALSVLCLPFCQAADQFTALDVKTGLWETTTKTDMSGMMGGRAMPQIPEETLAKLPAAQRAQIEASMKGMGGGTNTSRSCVTNETLTRSPQVPADNSCTYKIVSSSSSKQEVHADCTRGPRKFSGDVTVERVDAEHVKGTMAMKTDENGPVAMKISWDRKWISSDCGDVKPVVIK